VGVVVGVDGAGRTFRLRRRAAEFGPNVWWAEEDIESGLARAREDGSLVVVDDAHRLSSDALLTLAAAARDGVPMIISRRPTISGPELAALDEAVAGGGFEVVEPLGRDEVAAVVATATGRTVSPETAAAVHEASAGLAVVAAALADALAASVGPPPDGGSRGAGGGTRGTSGGFAGGVAGGGAAGRGGGGAAAGVGRGAAGEGAARGTGAGRGVGASPGVVSGRVAAVLGAPAPALVARVQRRFAVLAPEVAAVARVLALRLELADDALAAAGATDPAGVADIMRTLRDEGLLVPGEERMIPAVAVAVFGELSAAERRRLHEAAGRALLDTGADPVATAIQLRAARTRTPAVAPIYVRAGEATRFTDPAAALAWFDDADEAGADPADTAAGRAEAAVLLGLPVDIDLAIADPAIADRAIADRAVADPAVAERAIAERAIADPTIADPAVADRAMAERAVADRAMADPTVADPAVAHRAIADPAVADRAVADRAVADRAVADRAVANRAVADPAVADRAMADPTVADPAVAHRAIADPAVADRAVADRAIGDRAIGNRAVADRAMMSPGVDQQMGLPATDPATVGQPPRGAGSVGRSAWAGPAAGSVATTVNARLARLAGAAAARDGRTERAASILLGVDPNLAVPVLVGVGRLDEARMVPGDRFGEAARSAAVDPDAAVPLLIEAVEAAERSTPTAVLPDTPHAVGATVAVAAGDLAAAEHLLERAGGFGGPAAAERHRLLLAWARMRAGRYDTALAELARPETELPGRERLLRAAIAAGIARRRGDIAALRAVWGGVEPVLARRVVDLWQLEPAEELLVAAARLHHRRRVEPVIELLERTVDGLGRPPAWAAALGWLRVQVAVAAGESDEVARQAGRIPDGGGARGDAQRTAAVLWAEVLAGPAAPLDPDAVLAATDDLAAAQLPWEASRLAGQAAIHAPDPTVARRLLERARELSEPDSTAEQPPAASRASGLSERELAVAKLVVAGSTHKEIGAQLYIAPKTVEHHVARIRSKLGAGSRAELLAVLREIVSDPG
jgi:DNA-binding CsgD family transcriptional regulator